MSDKDSRKLMLERMKEVEVHIQKAIEGLAVVLAEPISQDIGKADCYLTKYEDRASQTEMLNALLEMRDTLNYRRPKAK